MHNNEVPIENQEKLVLVVHEHWMILVRIVLLYILATALAGFMMWAGFRLHTVNPSTGIATSILAYLILIAAQHWFFIYLISIGLSGWAITEKRVIDFQFLPYVRHNMSYINIDQITETEKDQQGVVKNLLHYGDVELNISASHDIIRFHYVPYPGIFVETLSRLQHRSSPPSK